MDCAPPPFLLGAAYITLGLGLSAAFVKETEAMAGTRPPAKWRPPVTWPGISRPARSWVTSFSEPTLSPACQTGMANNLNDGLAWGVFLILFARHGLNVSQIGILAALCPGVWGAGQLATGTRHARARVMPAASD